MYVNPPDWTDMRGKTYRGKTYRGKLHRVIRDHSILLGVHTTNTDTAHHLYSIATVPSYSVME